MQTTKHPVIDENHFECCTHYKTAGFDEGYIILPIFKVKVCQNCGEVHAVWGDFANILFMVFFRWFWTGFVHIHVKDEENESPD